MTSGAITLIHVLSGMNRDDVVGRTSKLIWAAQDMRWDMEFAGEPIS